ncbi:MAG: hypothetical protein IKC64_01030 [Clostridia bacterium]|nr:hypothetical protein [Clostridia bacterium]
MLRNFLDALFDNVGGKLKRLTRIVCAIGIVCNLIVAVGCVVGGIILAIKVNYLYLFAGLFACALVFVTGTFFCWLASASTYIMGVNAENLEIIKNSLYTIKGSIVSANAKMSKNKKSTTKVIIAPAEDGDEEFVDDILPDEKGNQPVQSKVIIKEVEEDAVLTKEERLKKMYAEGKITMDEYIKRLYSKK